MAELIPELTPQYFKNSEFLNGGELYTYEAGTTTPKAVYKDVDATEAHTNPIVLNSRGEPPTDIRIKTGAYKFVLKDAEGNQIWVRDNVQSVAEVISTEGALAVANNLSDLDDVDEAKENLDIDPLSQPVETTITNGMSATSISGYDFTPGNWVHIEYFVTRNSGGVLGSGVIDLHYDGSAWQIVEGPYRAASGKPYSHGLTFSMSTNQLQVAADSSGAGKLITKYHSA